MMVFGRYLFDGFATFVHQDLFGLATRTDCDLHQPLNGGRCEIVKCRDSDVEKQGKKRHDARGPVTDHLERDSVDICPQDHNF